MLLLYCYENFFFKKCPVMLPKVEAAKADRGRDRYQIAEQKAASFFGVKNSSKLGMSAKLN